MNLPTIMISLLVIAMFLLAIRYLIKNGTCVGCSEKESGHCSCHSCNHTGRCQLGQEEAKH